jgi:hypothetical protein
MEELNLPAWVKASNRITAIPQEGIAPEDESGLALN